MTIVENICFYYLTKTPFYQNVISAFIIFHLNKAPKPSTFVFPFKFINGSSEDKRRSLCTKRMENFFAIMKRRKLIRRICGARAHDKISDSHFYCSLSLLLLRHRSLRLKTPQVHFDQCFASRYQGVLVNKIDILNLKLGQKLASKYCGHSRINILESEDDQFSLSLSLSHIS